MKAGIRISVSRALRVWPLVVLGAFCIVLAYLAAFPASAQAPASLGPDTRSIEAVGARIAGDEQKTRFVLDLSSAVGYTVTVLSDPFRVVVDMPDVDFNLPPGIGRLGRGLVQEYRYGRLADDKARIVIDAAAPVLIDRTFMLEASEDRPARMVIDLVRTQPEVFARIRDRLDREAATGVASRTRDPEQKPSEQVVAAEDLPMKEGTTASGKRSLPPIPRPRPASLSELAPILALATGGENAGQGGGGTVTGKGGEGASSASNQTSGVKEALAALSGNARVEPTAAFASIPAIVPPAKPKQPARPKKPVIVIDPGHGGIDPGALSRSGTKEKNVVLAFARTLRDDLKATGRYEVRMTRDDDRFISLRGRVEVAQKHHADLFISVHADSLKRGRARGSTVYTLSDKASDQEAAEIAAAENKADLVAGIPIEAESEDLTEILVDLVQRETRNHSKFFAATMVSNLKTATRLNTKPHRYAGFRVLRAPDVPSVLVELGYLSSQEDERLLVSSSWRQRVSKAMVAAVDQFFGTDVVARK